MPCAGVDDLPAASAEPRGRLVTAPRRRVLDVVDGRITVEQSGKDVIGSRRMAVVAHFSQDAQVTRSFDRLLTELRAAQYAVIVSSSCPAPTPLVWPSGSPPEGVTILRKPNLGYDFGSWAVAIARFPQLADAEHVLVVNDSMVGPFSSLAPAISAFESSPADVWALSSNYQFGFHLQSFFLGFHREAFTSQVMRRFWADVRVEPTKDEVIRRYELGLSRLLRSEGFILDAEFDASMVVAADYNPVILGWRRLLELGYPFVKRELLTNPSVAPGARALPAVIRDMFGEDVREWL